MLHSEGTTVSNLYRNKRSGALKLYENVRGLVFISANQLKLGCIICGSGFPTSDGDLAKSELGVLNF